MASFNQDSLAYIDSIYCILYRYRGVLQIASFRFPTSTHFGLSVARRISSRGLVGGPFIILPTHFPPEP